MGGSWVLPREIFKEIKESGRISGLLSRLLVREKILVPMKKCRCPDLGGWTGAVLPREIFKELRKIDAFYFRTLLKALKLKKSRNQSY